MQPHAWVAALACAALGLAADAAEGAGARRLGTGLLPWAGDAAGLLCTVTNIGSKPVSIGVARVFSLAADPAPPLSDECSAASLEPFETCRFTAEPGHAGGYVEVLGDLRNLRGHCLVFDANGTPLAEGEMR